LFDNNLDLFRLNFAMLTLIYKVEELDWRRCVNPSLPRSRVHLLEVDRGWWWPMRLCIPSTNPKNLILSSN
jgi:hypothetical protein